MERVVTLESTNRIQASTLPSEMLAAARKSAGVPREFVLRPNFLLGSVDLELILDEVRKFYHREALLYTKNDEAEAQKLLGKK